MHYPNIVVAGKIGEDLNLTIWRNKKICPQCIAVPSVLVHGISSLSDLECFL